MMQSVPFTPATDPLGHSAPLDQRASFPLLGLPLEVRSNSPAVIAAAERSFGAWRDLDPALVEPAPPLVVSLVVHPAGDQAQPLAIDTPFIQRVHGSCFLAAGAGSLLTAQMDHGTALGFVTPELIADDIRFRYNVLECLALLLASWRDRTPVHAGAVVRRGRALLLAGRSTAGKSTLCYACIQAGFQLLAEDVIYASTRSGLRLWGNPGQIHLLPDAWQHFPELADIAPRVQANGKRKLVVEVTALGSGRVRHYAEHAAICLVQRHDSVASALEPIDPQLAIDMICQDLESGFDIHERAPEVAHALATGGAYRLSVGSDLAAAVALLKTLTDEAS